MYGCNTFQQRSVFIYLFFIPGAIGKYQLWQLRLNTAFSIKLSPFASSPADDHMEVLMQTDGVTDGRRDGGCGAGSAVGQRQRSSSRSLMRVNQVSCVAAGLNISDAEAKGAATLGVILQVALYCKSIHTHTHTHLHCATHLACCC